MNAVERESVPTRVLNHNASEASYKPEQRRGEEFFGGWGYTYNHFKFLEVTLCFFYSNIKNCLVPHASNVFEM